MAIKAIIYVSSTGHTREYAKMLGKKLSLPAYSFDRERGMVPTGSEIIFMGWIMAGKVMGLTKVSMNYTVRCLIGVGMGETGSQIDDIKSLNEFPSDCGIFSLQGGFELDKMRGLYKLIMSIMRKSKVKSLTAKENRTREEDALLRMFRDGGNYVSEKNLKDVVAWYKARTNSLLEEDNQ